jgi:hypothetical protein
MGLFAENERVRERAPNLFVFAKNDVAWKCFHWESCKIQNPSLFYKMPTCVVKYIGKWARNAFVLKTDCGISLKICMVTYDYLYLLDSEKSKIYCFIMLSHIEILPMRSKTMDKKIRKMTNFKANFGLVKESFWTKIKITLKIWTFISKEMSKTCLISVFVCLNYRVE